MFLKIEVIALFSILGYHVALSSSPDPLKLTYDFIVVGSGPGGSTVASRLSENPNWNVLLLEAGKVGNAFLDVPIFYGYNQQTHYNWNYTTEPQEFACLGNVDRRCKWPRGKGLGGSTLLNGLVYTRGYKADYDNWAELGNEGWSFDEVWPFFLKSENIRISEYLESESHQRGGPLNIERVKFRSKMSYDCLEAAKELGYDLVDFNDGTSMEGFSRLQETMNNGHRESAYDAFIEPVLKRPNLKVSSESLVSKVIINPETLTAEGVEVIRGNRTYRVRATKEVVLSAGTLGSPQILMLSGVGPKEHLEELNIPVLKDLPVGQTLLDHIGYTGIVFVANRSILEETFSVRQFFDFFDSSSGIVTLPGSVEVIGFLRTEVNDDPKGRPDVELMFTLSAQAVGRAESRQILGLEDNIYDEIYGPIEDLHHWSILPLNLHPKSKGYMQLRSNSIHDSPKFYPNYLQDQRDVDALVASIKIAVALSKTKAFASYGSYFSELPIKECTAIAPMGSDEYYGCAIRYVSDPGLHFVATCKMGPDSDPYAVVNSQLQVKGVKNLRVADASVAPELPTANMQAPTYMIGEKASDMIKNWWQE